MFIVTHRWLHRLLHKDMKDKYGFLKYMMTISRKGKGAMSCGAELPAQRQQTRLSSARAMFTLSAHSCTAKGLWLKPVVDVVSE